ncbi:MAG: EF-Tu C-terminal domain-related protein [Mucilaginibacter sp.]
MDKKPDFIAELKYLTTDAGGRRTPVLSGYRPQVRFAFSEMQTSGQQKFLDKEVVYPGEIVNAEISILSPQFFEHMLYPGMSFEFREGSRIIGTGQIIKIINENLLAK